MSGNYNSHLSLSQVEALTKQLEEEMEKKEQQSEFFGACQACNEKVTGAGQACQVRNI